MSRHSVHQSIALLCFEVHGYGKTILFTLASWITSPVFLKTLITILAWSQWRMYKDNTVTVCVHAHVPVCVQLQKDKTLAVFSSDFP